MQVAVNIRLDEYWHEQVKISNIVNINCPTSLYPKYFLPSTVKAWNDLPLPTRNLESLNSFKSLINTESTKVPAHYCVGWRLVRYHMWDCEWIVVP